MEGDNADDFTDAIFHDNAVQPLHSNFPQSAIQQDLVQRLISHALESEDELTTSSEESLSDDGFDGINGAYNLSSSYYDIFDNIMSKYVCELNTKDAEMNKKLRELGNMSIFAHSRLQRIEEEVCQKFYSEQQLDRASKVIRANDRAVEADERLKRKAMMQGSYEFKFGPSTVSMSQKLDKISGEPAAFQLYKRRDLESKIDKLAIGQLRLARLIFSVAQQARKEYDENMRN